MTIMSRLALTYLSTTEAFGGQALLKVSPFMTLFAGKSSFYHHYHDQHKIMVKCSQGRSTASIVPLDKNRDSSTLSSSSHSWGRPSVLWSWKHAK